VRFRTRERAIGRRAARACQERWRVAGFSAEVLAVQGNGLASR
jgi:hypothetical protein